MEVVKIGLLSLFLIAYLAVSAVYTTVWLLIDPRIVWWTFRYLLDGKKRWRYRI